MFNIGLVSITFRTLPPEKIITLAHECGLSAIEWGSDVHAPACNPSRLKLIKTEMDRLGLYTSSYGTYFRIGENSTDELYDYISAASLLGTKTLRLWCGRKNYGDMSDCERKFIIEKSKEAARIAESRGVRLCLECHNKTFTNCLDGALEIMRGVSSEAFRMYWQPSHLVDEQTNFEYAKAIASYTVNLHVFNHTECGKHPLSDAADKWKRYLSAFDGSQHLLFEFMPDNSEDSLCGEAKSLSNIIKELNCI